jgi:glycerol-3-phosphate dehydrogenase (NAD(P)+)
MQKLHKSPQNISILGDGGWGTALALLLCENGHHVTAWGPFPNDINAIIQKRENSLYLPGIPLPEDIVWTADRAAATAQADVVVLATPTKFFRSVAESFASLIPPSCMIVSVAKGLDSRTHQRMTQVAEEVLGRSPVAALSGPSLAPEVARGIPTAVVVASRSEEHSRELQTLFASSRFRVYTSDDRVGVELGGALKNIIALAAGISDGLGYGDNTRAALMTRGLAEITRLGVKLGAKPATFAGLSGAGDLIVTCASKISRNHSVGERIGRGETLKQILSGMKQVAEGVWNCQVALDLARRVHVEVPIIEQVCAVVHEGRNPKEALVSLMTREAKPEMG